MKTKDPSIYDSKQKFFEQQPDFSKPTSKSKTEEKVTLRDYERKLILEKGGKFSDDEDIHPLTFTEEQNQLKKGFKEILDHCDDDDGDLLVKRETNSSEKVRLLLSLLKLNSCLLLFPRNFQIGKGRWRIQGVAERSEKGHNKWRDEGEVETIEGLLVWPQFRREWKIPEGLFSK